MEVSEPFRFCDLPIDIRHEIYKIHLVNQRGYVSLVNKMFPLHRDAVRPALGVNLLLACKAIYVEAVRVLYGYNNFSILPCINFSAAINCKSCSGIAEWTRRDPFGPPWTIDIKSLELIGRKNHALIRKVSTLQMATPFQYLTCPGRWRCRSSSLEKSAIGTSDSREATSRTCNP